MWGTGSPMREFLFVDDLAEAVNFALENTLPEYLYNVGTGTDLTIRELAEQIRTTVGFEGEILWDATKPDGTPRKLMDSSKMHHLGWSPKVSLEEGIQQTYHWFLQNKYSFKQVKL